MPSWADDILTCAPLRDAVYRNRTPDRGLRHSVSLGCLPFRSFAAVAPWLPPWDIVPPAEACAKVTSLEINIRTGRDWRRSFDELARVAQVLSAAGGSKGPTPFGNVRTLNLHFTNVESPYDAGQVELLYPLQRIFQRLPNLESFVGDRLFYNDMSKHVWLTGDSDLPLLADDQGTPAYGSAAVEAFRKMPRLRTVDIRRVDMYLGNDMFFTSLLLCRGTLKTLSCGSFGVVAALVRSAGDSDDFRIRHTSETPLCPEPESIGLTPGRRVPANVVPRVPVHWTLETLVVDPCEVLPPAVFLHKMIVICPRLKAVTIRGVQSARDSAWASVSIALQFGDFFEVTISRGNGTKLRISELSTCTSDGRIFSMYNGSAPKLNQLAGMRDAHRYVQAVVAGYVADRSLLPEALSRHRAGLDAVVDGGAYPAALLWTFARGPEHTTLRSLCLRDVTVSGEDAASAAVVALAAWRRRRH